VSARPSGATVSIAVLMSARIRDPAASSTRACAERIDPVGKSDASTTWTVRLVPAARVSSAQTRSRPSKKEHVASSDMP
jgi:hypothetical protein